MIRSPRGGRVFSPHNQVGQSTDNRQPRFWTSTPLDPTNRGAWLEEGTILCVVGDQSAREAIVLLRQQDIELIGPNQTVTLLLADKHRGAVTGRVLEVAASPSQELPKELARDGIIDPSATESSQNTPYYQVRVSLERTSGALPVRLTGHAQISVSSASILTRIGRFLSGSFGFEDVGMSHILR
jgi:putative peptide zinc metalloprotease protein